MVFRSKEGKEGVNNMEKILNQIFYIIPGQSLQL